MLYWSPVVPRPWTLVTVFRLVLLTELWVLSSPQGRWIVSSFPGWDDSWMVFIFSCYVCKLLAGCLQPFFPDLLNLQIRKGNPKVLSSDIIFYKTHPKLAVRMWLLGKTSWFLRGVFCAPSAAPTEPCFFISFSLGWKKGLLWEWCPTTEATVSSEDFEKRLLSNFAIAEKWRSLHSAIWKEYGCVSKKEHPKWKKYVHIGKQYLNAKSLSPVTDYRKYLMFGVG